KDEQNGGGDDTYRVTAEDITTGTTISIDPINLSGEAPSGNLKLVTADNTTVGKHTINITVEKLGVEGTGKKTIKNFTVDVKKNLNANLSTGNLTKDTVNNIFTKDLTTGDAAEVFVTNEEGSGEYTYQWQIAKADADITAAPFIDPKNSPFEDIAGETDAKLQKAVTIDDNGKYVRCIVTDSAGNQAVARGEISPATTGANPTPAVYGYCVKLNVTDKNLVCASPTEDQDVSVIMTQTKDLTVEAKAGTKADNTQTGYTDYAADGYKYVWKKDGVVLTNETFVEIANPATATLTIKPGTEKDAEGDYVCVIEDGAHQKVTSPVFHVTVADMPKLTLDPSVVTAKAEYANNGTPVNGEGETFIATADKENPVTFTAKIENPADVKSVKWETSIDDGAHWKGELQGESTTWTLNTPADGMLVKATVEFKDIPCTAGTIDKALAYQTKIYVTDGTLSGNVYEYTGNTDTEATSPTYVIELPKQVYWNSNVTSGITTTTPADGTSSLTQLTGHPFTINLPVYGATGTTTGVNKYFKAVVTVAPVAGKQTLNFKVVPTATEAATDVTESLPMEVHEPYVKNMSVKIPAHWLTDKMDGTPNGYTKDVVLPVSDKAGYKIVRSTEAADLTLKKKSVPYNTKEQPAEIIAKDDAKIGEISEVRYMTLAEAKKQRTDGSNTYQFVTQAQASDPVVMSDLTEAQTKAFLAALSSEVPVDTDEYIVVCNVAASDELAAAENVLVPDTYTIAPANKNTVEKDPETFFTYTKEKVYNGDVQEADVKLADGMTKAGKIKKVTYMTVDSKGVLVEATPIAVGTYRLYVTTEADPSEVDTLTNVGEITATADEPGAYIGDYRITKLPLSKDLFKMDPTEADYTGNPIVPEITTETPGVGEIEAVHYYPEGSEEELGSAPVAAGVYTVKIDVKEGENYDLAKGLEIGTLTINSQETHKPTLYMRGHVQNNGWDAELTEVKPGSETMIGTTGSALRVEAIDIVVPEGYTVGGFAHVQNEGDVTVTEVPADAVDYPAGVPEGYKVYRFGSTGKGQRLEAIQTEIKDASGALLEGLKYQVHVENKAWMGYVANGSFAGTRGLGLRLEALRFAYEGTPAPTEPETPAEPEKPAEETPATPETPAETPETPAV
ncbi:MAG: hypothetical protein IJH61_07120, partial [Eubacteriaceae bacterium]|nr:hypothetical protein [Eubacteriaceae bacterium]